MTEILVPAASSVKKRKTRRGKIVLSGVVALLAVAWFFCLPDPLFDVPYSTVLLDREGNLLSGRIAADGQWRFPGDREAVPETFAKAIVAYEDKRFYQHGGVDPIAFSRAIWHNIRNKEVVSGGSTITMQVMRLAREGQRRTIWQKVIEMGWAWRAEIRFSKKEILNLYASHAPFGGNVVGLEAASWRYFHKTADQLSWGEAATLAVLPNAPGLIHPGRNRDALRTKRNALLDKLAALGEMDAIELSLAKDEPIPDAPHPLPDLAPHLISHYHHLDHTLRSTIDLTWQVRLTELLQRHGDILRLNGVHNAALLVMETNSGEVRAYVGNIKDEARQHHNDVDVIQSRRSSGSILKPFLYCAALEQALVTPSGVVEDIPTYIKGYQPLNFTKEYTGMIPADEALAMSLNVPAVRQLQQYGILPFMEKLKEAGISTLSYSPDHYGLPLILGGAEVTLWDVCGAYASMGRVLHHLYPYNQQYDPRDIHPPVLFSANRRKEEIQLQSEPTVWNAAAIYQTFEAMSSLRRPDQEGQWETFRSARKIAWKTGTSFGFRDAWAVGVTPEYTVGIWIGNADGEGRPGVIGLHAAAPVLFDVVRMLDGDEMWWPVPYEEMAPTLICNESGWLAGDQCSQTDTAWIVKGHHTPAVCRFHMAIYTDPQMHFRYEPQCKPANAALKTYFVVPALAENFYKRHHPSYRILPPFHPDCMPESKRESNMAILYPRQGSRIYVPYSWNKEKSKAVFSAVHRFDTAYIYWHLDKQYIGRTREHHQIEMDPPPGKHRLVLQDEFGGMIATDFEVIEGTSR